MFHVCLYVCCLGCSVILWLKCMDCIFKGFLFPLGRVTLRFHDLHNTFDPLDGLSLLTLHMTVHLLSPLKFPLSPFMYSSLCLTFISSHCLCFIPKYHWAVSHDNNCILFKKWNIAECVIWSMWWTKGLSGNFFLYIFAPNLCVCLCHCNLALGQVTVSGWWWCLLTICATSQLEILLLNSHNTINLHKWGFSSLRCHNFTL